MSPKTPKQITHHCNRCGRKNERPLNPHPTPAIFGRKTLHTFGDTLRLAPYHAQIWPQYKGKANVVDLHLEVGALFFCSRPCATRECVTKRDVNHVPTHHSPTAVTNFFESGK